ncbi:MAG: hypothetical protein AB7S81_04680 [Bdellovibrionales bacterium]
MSNIEQPVRDIVPTATIKAGTRGIQPPEGTVYTVTFLDGTSREIFVESNDKGEHYFDTCRFLNEGRKTNLLSEVWDLIVTDHKDRPARHVIERMKKEAIARGAQNAPIPSVS